LINKMEENNLNMMFMSSKDKNTFSYCSFFIKLVDRTAPVTVSFSDFFPANDLFTLSFSGKSIADIVSAFYIP